MGCRAAILIASLLVAGCSGTAASPHPAASSVPTVVVSTTPPAADPTTMALTKLAKDAASNNGEPDVSTAQVVRTTRQAAAALGDHGFIPPDPGGQVIVLGLTGSFVIRHHSCPAPVPPRTDHCPDPTGRFLYLGVDPTTLESYSLRLRNDPLDLSELGPVETLRW
ncbi:hypothetical protein BL253_21715 [Pseudofrankia asymbiotica]|uniref:Uncharacterized protein n=1 Tax=Pseudofrankia asymbiotica TaxID=1834516 RepID=A0A1V2I6Z4_9ACTN|nr:hypothetical protein BL253_21715 [Pseudofrankia asymbiotica]